MPRYIEANNCNPYYDEATKGDEMTPLADRIQEFRGEYGYRITKCPGGSDKYGPCEVCTRSVETTYHQVECRKTEMGWTYYRCHNLFGHKDCLISKRK